MKLKKKRIIKKNPKNKAAKILRSVLIKKRIIKKKAVRKLIQKPIHRTQKRQAMAKKVKFKKVKKIIKKKTQKKTRFKKQLKRIKAKKKNKKILRRKVIKKSLKTKTLRKVKKVSNTTKNALIGKKESKIIKSNISFSGESFFKARIKVIGIGGGGGSIVSEIGGFLNKATFVIADTDARAFKKRRGIKYFLFGQELIHGLGTGLNLDLARSAAEQEKERIAKLFENQDIIIFIASLGGGLGSGATQVFIDASKNFGGITLGIFTLPFKFEGRNKYRIANKALYELRKSLNVSITIPNERIFKIIDNNTAITDAFSTINRSLIKSLESLIDLIYNHGVINIDFADLRSILKGKGNLAFLNTAEASGKNRSEKIAQEILYNPLYQKNNFTAQKVLFNISGSNNLSMFEVDKISRIIADQNPKAKIIFGISKNSGYKNKIKTTLLMTGPSSLTESAIIKTKTEKNVLKREETDKEKKTSRITQSWQKGIATKEGNEEKIPFVDTLAPVFNKAPVGNKAVEIGWRKLSIVQARRQSKKAIRRTALEINKAQEIEENKKSMQEKEWEIPTFLRKIKFKS